MAQTLDGYTITTIEQEGDYVGEDVGRLWFKTPRRDEWCWYGGFASEARPARRVGPGADEDVQGF